MRDSQKFAESGMNRTASEDSVRLIRRLIHAGGLLGEYRSHVPEYTQSMNVVDERGRTAYNCLPTSQWVVIGIFSPDVGLVSEPDAGGD